MADKCDFTQIYNFNFLRGLLLLFNVLLWISGLLIILTAIWLQTDFLNYLRISRKYSTLGPYVLAVIGTIIIFAASLACSCIVKVEHSALVFYGSFLITTMFTLIFLSIYIYTYKNQVITGIPAGIHKEILVYNAKEKHANVTLIDFIQNNLHCCGNNSHLDWLGNGNTLPNSCCHSLQVSEDCAAAKPAQMHQVGCLHKLIRLVNMNLTNVGIMLSAIALFPLFAMVLAFSLASFSNKLHSGYERIA